MTEEGPPLDPCPFCGPVDWEYIPIYEHEIKESKYWSVWCGHCDFYGPLFHTKELAAKHWNTRR